MTKTDCADDDGNNCTGHERPFSYSIICQATDKSAKPVPAPLQPVPLPAKLWQKLAIDIVGPFQSAPYSARFAITLMDYYTRWQEVGFSSRITTKVVIDFLNRAFSREGLPDELVSDHGPQFTSALFAKYLEERGIKHRFSSVYSPQANELIERFNRVPKDYVQLALLQQKPIPQTVVEYLGLSHIQGSRLQFNAAESHVRKTVHERQMKMKRYTDLRRKAKVSTFRPGHLVRIRMEAKSKGMPSYSKPLRMKKQCGKNSFLLQDNRIWNASKLVLVTPNEHHQDDERLSDSRSVEWPPVGSFGSTISAGATGPAPEAASAQEQLDEDGLASNLPAPMEQEPTSGEATRIGTPNEAIYMQDLFKMEPHLTKSMLRKATHQFRAYRSGTQLVRKDYQEL
ncbi:uncharacterized protein K02A2.6-like [Ornithodoros turicata]|uniref:uncharacterized protein K02A2.6-like n=1 Tax=Ornithodoros turicata TaxID=34597 RepID=UPI003139AB4D